MFTLGTPLGASTNKSIVSNTEGARSRPRMSCISKLLIFGLALSLAFSSNIILASAASALAFGPRW